MHLETTWWEYVQRIALSDSYSAIARKIGVDRSTVTRWKNGGGVDLSYAVAFARAYDRPIVEALEVLNIVSAAEVGQLSSVVSAHISELSDADLIAELQRRLRLSRQNLSDDNVVSLPKTIQQEKLRGVAKRETLDVDEDSHEI